MTQMDLYKAIDAILWKDWDPIGVNDCESARDEYQSYVPRLVRMKLGNASVEDIAEMLNQIVIYEIGMSSNIDECKRVAKLIEELK